LQVIAITISALALTISALTAWLTMFRRGTVKMTHPSVIYFGPDGGPKLDHEKIAGFTLIGDQMLADIFLISTRNAHLSHQKIF
jgi:hypothetical protein